jgi:hypothetical protein
MDSNDIDTTLSAAGSQLPATQTLFDFEKAVLVERFGRRNDVPLGVGQFYLRKKGGSIRRVVKIHPRRRTHRLPRVFDLFPRQLLHVSRTACLPDPELGLPHP